MESKSDLGSFWDLRHFEFETLAIFPGPSFRSIERHVGFFGAGKDPEGFFPSCFDGFGAFGDESPFVGTPIFGCDIDVEFGEEVGLGLDFPIDEPGQLDRVA